MLNFMSITENQKGKSASYYLIGDTRIWWEGIELSMDVNPMTWQEFLRDFNEQYFNMSVTKEHYDEFKNFRQENLSMTEAIKWFNQLARLCPHMVSNEEERVKRMIRMLRPETAAIVDRELYSNPIVLEMFDYNLILVMDFLGKYNTPIVC
ncbi:hypothetical protein TIFTF001_035088 [Ficus carica]|uniref:Retrotransposon gag domain-containing protein n=1 Tax=Ficus carica TaxID=3494 RepID=A0AA88E9J0_FICCA|nr:hypothetical protein TIFTF001_035088 [Ficus carica]